MKPPKVAGGGTKIDFGAFIAPMVLPGDYTVKLKVGDKEYVKPLKLVHDTKNKDFTLEDRQLQYKTAMHLYALHTQLAAIVDTLNARQQLMKTNIPVAKDSSNKKLFEEYNRKLDELKSTLLATKQKSIFADEKKLREDITDVYVAVADQESRPSNLQLERAVQLQQKVQKAEDSKTALVRQYDDKVNTALKKEAQKPSKVF